MVGGGGPSAACRQGAREAPPGPGRPAALDYGLPQRALIAISGRVGDVAELITRRLTTLAHSGLTTPDEPAVCAVVRQAVRDIRTAPPPPLPVDPPADPTIAEMRALVDRLAVSAYSMGELLLEVAPAYLSGEQAADVLALLCNETAEDLEHGLAARRYVLTGDRRALDGTPLNRLAAGQAWLARWGGDPEGRSPVSCPVTFLVSGD